MIRVERVALPAGLRALAYRDHRGNLVVYVSDRLEARGQRAAVMEAVRASRRAGWRQQTGLPPVAVATFLAIRALLRQVGRTVGARPVAWGAAATATAVGASTAAVFIAAAPHPHGPSAAGRPAGPSTVRSVPPSVQPSGGSTPGRRQVHPGAVASVSPGPGRPAGSGQPRPDPTSPGSPGPAPAPAPAPAPSPTSTQPAPAPSPSPSPSPSGGTGVCVVVLGIKVCVPALSVRA